MRFSMLACLVATANCLLGNLFGPKSYGGLCVMGEDSIMDQKKHGTSDTPVQKGLRWNCDERTAEPHIQLRCLRREAQCRE